MKCHPERSALASQMRTHVVEGPFVRFWNESLGHDDSMVRPI